MSFPLILVPARQSISSNEASQRATKHLAILIIEYMEANMTWVCAECGGELIYPGGYCINDETHRGQMKLEDWEARQERREVIEREGSEAVELLFGPPDLR